MPTIAGNAARTLTASLAFAAAIATATPALRGQDPGTGDADVVRAIRTEGADRSEAMTIVRWLSDVYGPRVTGTPAIEAAGAWAAERMRSWGLDVQEERFAYGRGWSLERFHAHMVEPQVMPIIGYPRAWTPSTAGTVTAEVARVDLDSAAGRTRARGTLRGKVVLLQPEREVAMLEGDVVLRMDDELLARAARPGREEALGSSMPRFMSTSSKRGSWRCSIGAATLPASSVAGRSAAISPGRLSGPTAGPSSLEPADHVWQTHPPPSRRPRSP